MNKRESELKFTCEAFTAPMIKRAIESVCVEDGSFSENIINSIYFDTTDWLFAMEKASSDYLKTKIRMRWYESSFENEKGRPSKCYLEFKHKIGSKRTKSRILMPFTSEDAISSLSDEDCQIQLKKLIAENVPELSGHDIEPKFIVRYARNRYFEPFSNTRISFDTEIQAFNVGNNYAQYAFNVALTESVLEVKGNCDDLPQALRSVHAGRLKKAAFSKYYESFKLLTGYEQ